MNDNEYNEFDQLLNEIRNRRHLYGEITIKKFKCIKGVIQMRFAKSPVFYLVDTYRNYTVFSFSYN